MSFFKKVDDTGKELMNASCGIPEIGVGIIFMIALPFLIVIAAVYQTFFAPPPPPPKSIEEKREIRNEKANEAGKTVHEFLRGAAGFDKTKKPEKEEVKP